MLIFLNLSKAYSAQNPTLIRDTEIEATLKSWMAPVAKGSGLNPDSIKIIIVQDPSINAFVAGGANIFLFTGLLMKSETPEEIIGVLAHELGHIRGGHLVRARGAMESASYETLLGTLLGVGAAVLTGEGGLATAIISGTQTAAYSRYLSFSRVQESSADQAALKALENAKMNPQGLVSFMQKLEGEELLPASQQGPYVRTHPLTRDRISAMQAGLTRSPYKNEPYPARWQKEHDLMLAKLIGFITPQQVSWKYDTKDDSTPALYAKTIAAYRNNKKSQALSGITKLLSREPENPYFLELKGQILFEFGDVEKSIAPYKKSIEQLPNASLIRTAYARALIENSQKTGEKNALNEAITNLQVSLKDEPRNTQIHRLLATAYGRLGQEPTAKLHLAEESLLKGDIPYAKKQAAIAAEKLPKNSRAWLRAQDILNFIEQNEKRR